MAGLGAKATEVLGKIGGGPGIVAGTAGAIVATTETASAVGIVPDNMPKVDHLVTRHSR